MDAVTTEPQGPKTAPNIPLTARPRIVIIGGGFGGIELAHRLKHMEADVILIDKNNHHTFQPLLYQVATAALEAESITYPFREIFRHQTNLFFRMAEVLEVLPGKNQLRTSIGEIDYDFLVIATGSRTNYFGMKDFQEHAVPMKSVSEAVGIRNRLLENLEKAVLVKDLQEREALMTIAIIGGGPTGVEMAGALGELRRHVLPDDYKELDLKRMQIHVVDMEDRLIKGMSLEASLSAAQFLKRQDINLWLETKVVSYDGRVLTLSNGKRLVTNTVIWAAGVGGCSIPGIKPETLAGSRFKVDGVNRIEGYTNVFAIGDAACMVSQALPKGHPMLAPVAIQQARNLAGNFGRLFDRKPLQDFAYKDPGVMATVGRNHAVVDLRHWKFGGVLAWFVWVFVHLMTLVGFRNKLVVFINWAWNYLSYDRGLRLIIKPPTR